MRLGHLALVLFGMAALAAARVHAQGSPRQVVVGMILQLQTGAPDPAWYGDQVWESLTAQEDKTAIPALRKLGPAQDIYLVRQQQLPRGWLYSMTVQHTKGQSAWLLGIGSASNRVEYAGFTVGASLVAPLLPDPGPGNPAPQVAQRGSDACKRFPRLC